MHLKSDHEYLKEVGYRNYALITYAMAAGSHFDNTKANKKPPTTPPDRP